LLTDCAQLTKANSIEGQCKNGGLLPVERASFEDFSKAWCLSCAQRFEEEWVAGLQAHDANVTREQEGQYHSHLHAMVELEEGW
jgi:hypothetical protein